MKETKKSGKFLKVAIYLVGIFGILLIIMIMGLLSVLITYLMLKTVKLKVAIVIGIGVSLLFTSIIMLLTIKTYAFYVDEDIVKLLKKLKADKKQKNKEK